MNDTNSRREMVCPKVGGDGKFHLCIEGRRDDFPKDKNGMPSMCRWWVGLYGKTPQGEGTELHYDCAVPWNVTVNVENSQMTRWTGAEVNQLRNESHRTNQNLRRMAKVVVRSMRAARNVIQDRIIPAIEGPKGPVIDYKNGDQNGK
jgi:hypothetical protein